MVPMIADKIAKWIMLIIHGCSGKITASVSDTGIRASVNKLSGVERMIDAMNKVYTVPTIKIE